MNAFQRYMLPKKEELLHKQQELELKLQELRHKLQELQGKLQHVEFTDVYRVRNNEMYDVMQVYIIRLSLIVNNLSQTIINCSSLAYITCISDVRLSIYTTVGKNTRTT